MTDDSKIVLRWEIENARARFATGKVESEVFEKAGYKWTMIAEKDGGRKNRVNFSLKCDTDHNGQWKCETELQVRQYEKNGTDFVKACNKEHFGFDANNDTWIHAESDWSWSGLTGSDYMANGKTVLEFRINIISSKGGQLVMPDPAMFAVPNRMSNVILKIGDQKLHVSKELLALHSPVFETLFFGQFVEKGKEEVEIKDVVYEEFVDLLHLIYVRMIRITDRTVLHILKLSDRFQIESVLNEAILHLTDSKRFNAMAKLLVADQYNLADLKETSLKSFATVAELQQKMMASPEYEHFSADMKVAICDTIMKLKLQ